MAKARARQPVPRLDAPPPKPYGRWAAYAIVGVLVVIIVALMVRAPQEVPEGRPEGTEIVAITSRDHVDGPVQYDRLPPAGGNHDAVSLRCGIYENPVATESAVHTLEHGAIWITYLPDIGSGAVNALENASRVRTKTILSPLPGQHAPVIATAWGFQLALDDPNDVQLRQFIQHFESASSAPEPRVSC